MSIHVHNPNHIVFSLIDIGQRLNHKNKEYREFLLPKKSSIIIDDYQSNPP